jgi:CubicO group peptidase (beta-lactamase class C family)
VVRADGEVVAAHGDLERRVPIASVTKLLSALAILIAVEEGSVDLDQPAGPPGATLRHLLAHASGLGLDGGVINPPGRRRVYSNAGFEAAAATVEDATDIDFATYLREAVLEPLGMASTTLDGSPAAGATSDASDLARLARELLRPTLISPATHDLATSVAFEGLAGVVPGFGKQDPNDWGLGFEIRGTKHPHWTAPGNDPATFGHFGRSGSFVWVDPVAGVALTVVTDETFEQWAIEAWPRLGQAVLDARPS